MREITPNKFRILYVDDEKENLTNFKYVFQKSYEIHLAQSAEDAYRILKQHKIQLVIADQRMPKETGAEFLERIAPEYPDTIRIILTGYSPELCRGLAILTVLEPLSGAQVALLTARRSPRGVPRDLTQAKPSSCCQERPFFPGSERTSPAVTPSTIFFSALVTRTRLDSAGPKETPTPHVHTTSDRDTRPSLRP